MKKFIVFFTTILIASSGFAKYDFVMKEVKGGLDNISINARGETPDGELGRAVYNGKPENNDVFIPTTLYVRLGVNLNVGFANTEFKIDGHNEASDFSFGPTFGIGWNMFSFIRGEFGFSHNDMTYKSSNLGLDVAHLTLYWDILKRNEFDGDVMYRHTVVPFLGAGFSFGRADFEDSATSSGIDSGVYGGHINAGLNFVITDTKAIDLTAQYEYLIGSQKFGWSGEDRAIADFNVIASWRASF